MTPEELRKQLDQTARAVDRSAAACERLLAALRGDHERRASCDECGEHWNDPGERWRAYLTDDDPAAVVLYCPDCAAESV